MIPVAPGTTQRVPSCQVADASAELRRGSCSGESCDVSIWSLVQAAHRWVVCDGFDKNTEEEWRGDFGGAKFMYCVYIYILCINKIAYVSIGVYKK